MRTLGIALLALFLPMTVSYSVARDGRLQLSVMTFNVRYGTASDGRNSWTHRRPLVATVLRNHTPDIVGLQEALRFQLDEIRADLDHFGEIGAGRDDGRQGGEYAALLYRTDRFRALDSGTFWFSDSPGKPGSKCWGNKLPRICTWAHFAEKATGRGFYVFNVHLDHWSQASRNRSALLLARQIDRRKHPDPVIITGDFNVGERNTVVKFFCGRETIEDNDSVHTNACPMLDSFRSVYPRKQHGTLNLFRGIRFGPRIDFVLVPAGTDIMSAEIISSKFDGRYPSDHFPVCASVRLPTTPRRHTDIHSQGPVSVTTPAAPSASSRYLTRTH